MHRPTHRRRRDARRLRRGVGHRHPRAMRADCAREHERLHRGLVRGEPGRHRLTKTCRRLSRVARGRRLGREDVRIPRRRRHVVEQVARERLVVGTALEAARRDRGREVERLGCVDLRDLLDLRGGVRQALFRRRKLVVCDVRRTNRERRDAVGAIGALLVGRAVDERGDLVFDHLVCECLVRALRAIVHGHLRELGERDIRLAGRARRVLTRVACERLELP